MVHRDELLRGGEMAAIVARNTCYKGGTSTVGPSGFCPCGSGNFFLYRRFRNTRTPRCSSFFVMRVVSRLRSHGVTRVLRGESDDILRARIVLWRHNCRLSFCCDAPSLGKRTSCRVNWVGVASSIGDIVIAVCISVFFRVEWGWVGVGWGGGGWGVGGGGGGGGGVVVVVGGGGGGGEEVPTPVR